MRFLRTNTAIRLTVGPFFDKTDGVTPEVALTVTNCKLTLMVDDANVPTLVLDTNPTASGGANDMVHVTGDDAGFYDLELAAANVNYLGRAMLAITDAANHCPVFHEFMILPAMIYDSLVLGTDRLDTNVTHVGDTAQTARDIGLSVLVSSGTGTGQLDVTAGIVKANTTQFVGVNATATAGIPNVNTVQLQGTAQTGRDIGASVLLSPGTGTGQLDFTSGVVKANTTQFNGSSATSASGRPEVNVTHFGGSAGTFSSGRPQVTVFSVSSNAITETSFAVGTGLQSIRSNVAQAGANGSITLDASASSVNDFYKGARIVVDGGTGVGQARLCTAYDGTTKVASVAPNWATNPTSGTTFAIMPANSVLGVEGNVTGSVGSVSGAVGSVTGNVGGNVTGSIGSLATQAKADVNAEADAALSDYDGPTRAEATSDANSIVAAIPTPDENADGVLDQADGIETGMTLREAQRLQSAALAGKLSGAAGTTVTIRNAVADSKARITATVDADGNRTAVSTDVS